MKMNMMMVEPGMIMPRGLMVERDEGLFVVVIQRELLGPYLFEAGLARNSSAEDPGVRLLTNCPRD